MQSLSDFELSLKDPAGVQLYIVTNQYGSDALHQSAPDSHKHKTLED